MVSLKEFPASFPFLATSEVEGFSLPPCISFPSWFLPFHQSSTKLTQIDQDHPVPLHDVSIAKLSWGLSDPFAAVAQCWMSPQWAWSELLEKFNILDLSSSFSIPCPSWKRLLCGSLSIWMMYAGAGTFQQVELAYDLEMVFLVNYLRVITFLIAKIFPVAEVLIHQITQIVDALKI